MTADLLNQRDISRLSLDDRSKPLATIIRNDGIKRITRPQSVKYLRPRLLKKNASKPSNTVNRAPVQTSVSPVGALSP